jgi:hypothetical protein
MVKQKNIDYILGMITGASLMIPARPCTSGNPLNAVGNTIQEVKVVNQSWEPVYMDIVD